MMETQEPLVLCMDNSLGDEVALRVEPEDDFQSFLDKAKDILGFEVDLNLITGNQHISLTDNMYQFLLNAKRSMHNTQFEEILDPNPDSVYVLNDGTQIKASQIQFDNDDPLVDFAVGKIPFVKYKDDVDSDLEDIEVEKTVDYNIIESPVAKWSNLCSSPKNFVNSLPFKLVCTNTTAFENQFVKCLEPKTYAVLNNAPNRNKSPRSLIRDNYTKYEVSYKRENDNCSYTREEVLNLFKDSPVNSLPYEDFSERRHVRKSNPSRIHKSFKPLAALHGVLINENGNQICFLCDRKVDTKKIYLFDNEDQKILYRKSPQKKIETQLKIICDKCLCENFAPCSMKRGNQFLNPDEYLVIRNNQQYIFKKVKNIDFKLNNRVKKNKSMKINTDEFVKVEIGSDGEIVTKPVDEKSGDVTPVNKDSSSDVEIIEPETEIDTIIENLDDADEHVKEFLGKYQCEGNEEELKCRFCERTFSNISEVVEHGEDHKQEVDDDPVFPCPLCNYGYAHFKWLKGHLMAAHEKKKPNHSTSETTETTVKGTGAMDHTTIEVKCEVINEENLPSSDDEIWIVQTADADADETNQLQTLLDAAKVVDNQENESTKSPKCLNCSQVFPSLESLGTHRCRRRGRKRKTVGNGPVVCVPTQEDFIKRAQGRPRRKHGDGDNSVDLPKTRKKSKEPSSDPQVVTCDNCNESFTSKVRLKFHIQFHEGTPMLSEGRYKCMECSEAVFTTETALFDHVHFQHKLKRWHCPVQGCGKTFHLRATLTKHSRTHTDTRRYVCVTCGKRFLDKQTLDEHGVTHLQIKPFQCHICLKQLTRRSRLRMHVRAHEEELAPRRVLVCAVCARAFRDAAHAQEHASNSAECIEAFANDLKVEEEEAAVQLSPTSGIVRHTVQILESPKLSKPIPRQVASPLAKPLLAQVNDEAKSIIRVVEIEKAFRCEYCEDVFYLEESLNSHRAIHKGVRNPFTCHICKVSFATYSRVTTHKTTHGFYKRPLPSARQQVGQQAGEQVRQLVGPAATGILGYGDFPVVKHFLCEDCGRSYLHWTYLQVHRRLKHATQNCTYACNQCEMTFPNSISVAYHRKKVHGKAGPDDPQPVASKDTPNYRIPCGDCASVLPNKTALYKHRKKEHNNISCRPGIFCCGTCGKPYGSRAGLRAHAHRHGGTPPDCVRRWSSRGIHAWECHRCGRRCDSRPSLRAHLREMHADRVTVIEVEGSNPTTEDIARVLSANNISTDRVFEISKISFAKGTSSIIPDSARALTFLGDVPRTQIDLVKPSERIPVQSSIVEEFSLPNCILNKNIRRPKILQRGEDRTQPECTSYLEDLSDLNMQLLLRDGVLVDGNHMVQLQLNDNTILE